MIRTLSRSIFAAVGLLVLFGTIALFALPPKGHIPILMYHFVVPEERVGPTGLDVSLEAFEHQMWFLKTFRFRPISLREFYDIQREEKEPNGREIVITFDDGNRSYVEFALPILKRYEFPSANFLIGENVTGELHGSMSLEAARRLARDPLVTLGSHTMSHAVVTKIDPEQARKEIVESKVKLEEVLQHDVEYFTYPTGAFDDRAVHLVKEAGYLLAFTTSWKHLSELKEETRYTLARTKITSSDHLFRYWVKVSGIWSYLDRLKHVLDFAS